MNFRGVLEVLYISDLTKTALGFSSRRVVSIYIYTYVYRYKYIYLYIYMYNQYVAVAY